MPISTSAIVDRGTLDDDTDISRARNRTRFGDRDFDPWCGELADHDARHRLRQCLDESVLRCADVLDESPGDRLIVQCASLGGHGGGGARIGPDLEVDADRLLDSPLPLVKADDRVDLE